MKTRLLLIACCLLLGVACAKKPFAVSTLPADPCPMPAGYQIGPAIEAAKKTLSACPGKLDQVFMALITIAKHSPDKENAALIQEMLKGLIKENRISETYTKALYQRYFSPHFVEIPDLKVYKLSGEVPAIKRALKEELECKRMGLVDCCNDKESYRHAEGQYARTVGFIENLVYNDEYLKTQK